MHQHALDDAVGSAAMLDNLFKIAGGVASISRRMSSASKATAGGGRPPQLAQRPREFARVARGGIGGVTGGSGLGAEARLAQLGVGVSGRVDNKLIGGPIGVAEDLFAGQARSVIGFVPR